MAESKISTEFVRNNESMRNENLNKIDEVVLIKLANIKEDVKRINK